MQKLNGVHTQPIIGCIFSSMVSGPIAHPITSRNSKPPSCSRRKTLEHYQVMTRPNNSIPNQLNNAMIKQSMEKIVFQCATWDNQSSLIKVSTSKCNSFGTESCHPFRKCMTKWIGWCKIDGLFKGFVVKKYQWRLELKQSSRKTIA